ncbi:uncharacterized protein Z518_04851 [Rhinocladiella mackenziei CBS 650.93]|uniref:Rhinocladiella mackenziei CBS 650.93 unplaced genomic scaffold supercont1.3, whole genome shotgun sequence n=1 Tax=Rhinocladiella mackenziei CBS 650.93 TaxID=1442369 RepID=A0A0D2JCN0_9EURO|nr:uncharacterized protein Z518_04851 [Rhinocladiella mackenziei CBS 650.93]KIX06875.1 hypothetical protein Z518_04851 [Rhinocladiella mackenziei CBS 650.93]
MVNQMTKAGFINTQVVAKKIPIGPWSKGPMLKESGKFGLIAPYNAVYGMGVGCLRMCWDGTSAAGFSSRVSEGVEDEVGPRLLVSVRDPDSSSGQTLIAADTS